MTTAFLFNAMTNVSRFAPRALRGRVSARNARLTVAASLVAAAIVIGGRIDGGRHATSATAIADVASVKLPTPFLHQNAPQILAVELRAPRTVGPRADAPVGLPAVAPYLAVDRRSASSTPDIATSWSTALRRGYDATAPPTFLRASA